MTHHLTLTITLLSTVAACYTFRPKVQFLHDLVVPFLMMHRVSVTFTIDEFDFGVEGSAFDVCRFRFPKPFLYRRTSNVVIDRVDFDVNIVLVETVVMVDFDKHIDLALCAKFVRVTLAYFGKV